MREQGCGAKKCPLRACLHLPFPGFCLSSSVTTALSHLNGAVTQRTLEMELHEEVIT